jgi:hypothetical protein
LDPHEGYSGVFALCHNTIAASLTKWYMFSENLFPQWNQKKIVKIDIAIHK